MPEFRVGCYLSPKGLKAKAERIDADWGMVFLGNPRSFSGPLTKISREAVGDIPLVAHAPYAINIPHFDPWIFKRSAELLMEHAELAAGMGCEGLVVHAGQWKKSTHETALDKWEAVAKREYPVPIWIENQAQGGTSMAADLKDIKLLWDRVKSNPQFGFCLDTAHVWGYKGNSMYYVPELVDIVGKVDLVHANGSSVDAASKMDKHSPFASSRLPFSAVLRWIRQSGCLDLIAESADPETDISLLKSALRSE